MRNGPNRFIYYGVLIFSIILCVAAVFLATIFVINSYHLDQNSNTTPEYYTPSTDISSNTYTSNSLDIMLPNDNEVTLWTQNLVEELMKPDYLELDINRDRIESYFTKVGWWDFQKFLEKGTYSLSDFKIQQNQSTSMITDQEDDFGNHIWILHVPVSMSLEENKHQTAFEVEVMQSYNELKINRWELK